MLWKFFLTLCLVCFELILLNMKNIFRKLHLWVSIPFGIVITITCFTGALLVFESDITAFMNRNLTSVNPAGKPLPVDELVAKVEPALDEGVTVTGVSVSDNPAEAYKVNLSKPHRAAIYVDQYTGEVKGRYERPAFFDVTRRLHRWLMDTRPEDGAIYWGKLIVGASTLAFVAILITGIVIWWPRNRKMLKNRLQIAVKKGKNRFWYDLHVAGGFYAVLFLLAMALTGLTWSFEWYSKGFYGVMGIEMSKDSGKQGGKREAKQGGGERNTASEESGVNKTEPYLGECIGDCSRCDGVPCGKTPPPAPSDVIADASTGATVVADASTGATVVADASTGATVVADASTGATVVADNYKSVDRSHWQDALDSVLAKADDYSEVTVSDGVVTVTLNGLGNQRASDKYKFDKTTGEIISAELYSEAAIDKKAGGWVRTIHVGTWGGVLSKILYFLAALLGATLPLTGYYFWIRRLYGKKKSDKTK